VKRWLVAAAVGLATVLAVAGGIVMPGTARASSTAWYQVYQSGISGSFKDIAAISKANIWAVGPTSAAGKTVFTPFIRHFNGSSWQPITIPNGSGATSDWVSASASNNVWVGGLKNAEAATTVIYRWNGASWGRVPVPALTYLPKAIVLASNNVWALGMSGTVGFDVFHWNGSRWQYYLPNNINFVPQKISASAANNVWVSGFAFSGSKHVVAAYRWDGSAWHAVSMPHPVIGNNGSYVSAVSPSSVYIGWADNNASHYLRWDGRQWHLATTPAFVNVFDVVPDGKGGFWFGAQAILTGGKWASPQLPAFTGGSGLVTRILGTTSFVLNAGVQTDEMGTVKPTIFRFDL
jgi:hypothetical protein